MNSGNAKSVTVKTKWTTNCASGTTQVNVNLNVNGVQNFDYINNSIRCAVLQKDGYYKLEVWGAQGGTYTSSYRGGYGGYAIGLLNTNVAKNLYIVVGGQGTGSYTTGRSVFSGGYNGGGDSASQYSVPIYAGSGGGATHISTIANLLKNLSGYKDTNGTNISKEILIVGGGGGGAGYIAAGNNANGGNGGGMQAGYGTNVNGQEAKAYGGNQTDGGYTTCNIRVAGDTGSFGLGGSTGTYSNLAYGGAGGGGWYGGGANNGGCWASSGGGGSGYIGSSNLISSSTITKHMTCYSCTTSTVSETRTNSNTNVSAMATADYSKTGNGYARITYLGPSV